MVFEVVVRNPLVAHIWRSMPVRNVYRNWYLGRGAFVQKHPDTQGFVRSYVESQDGAAAIGSLFSASERLLRSALRSEGVKGPILNDTLPNLLGYCVSANHKFLNLKSACCDPRAIYWLNVTRKAVEHGDYRHDQMVMIRSGWKPTDTEDPDPDYLKIIDHRLLGPHQQLCDIFDRVDPETGLFTKDWEPRGCAQCNLDPKLHDERGQWFDEGPEVPRPPQTSGPHSSVKEIEHDP